MIREPAARAPLPRAVRRDLPLAGGLTAGYSGIQGMLPPAGEQAGVVAALWWYLFLVSAVVFVVVLALLLYAVHHRRSGPPEITEEGERRRVRLVAGGGVLTVVILFSVLIATLIAAGADARIARSARSARSDAPVVEVTGQRWWWEVRYLGEEPHQTFETANEIHLPVGRPVLVRLESHDVIHSFWVPRLHGKVDLIPGRTNELWLLAREPGVYRGQCAEFCGLQHAKMAFMVVAEPEAQFRRWLAAQRASASAPPDPVAARGQTIFLQHGCAACHSVRGTPAGGQVGPDLTHLASRLTLAAGIFPNTKGYLAGWVRNPQALKPGNDMPAVPLDGRELRALVHYLETLR